METIGSGGDCGVMETTCFFWWGEGKGKGVREDNKGIANQPRRKNVNPPLLVGLLREKQWIPEVNSPTY